MISHDDPRWTAYALGELDGAECADDRAAVEAALAEDPAARALVEEIRADGAVLAEALASEPQVALTLEQRGALLAAAAAVPPPVGRLIVGAPWRRWVPLGLVGAAAAALVAVSLMQTGGGGRGPGGAEVASANAYPRPRIDGVMTDEVLDAENPLFGGQGEELKTGKVDLDGVANGLQPGASSFPYGTPTGQGAGSSGKAAAPASSLSSAPPLLTFLGRARPGVVAGALPPPPGAPFGVPPEPASVGSASDTGIAYERAGYLVRLGTLYRPGIPLGSGPAAQTAPASEGSSGESYDTVVESPFQRVADAPLSTFSIDVDTASYANVRRMLNAGQRPPAAAVRLEEMLNYFPYADPAPKGDDPFAVKTEVAACPWNLKHRLVRIGVHGREIERKARPASNLVFLIDVSGSMDQPDKLPLVQASMRMLLEELNERDTVSIVVYAGASGLVLPPTSCEQKAVIQHAIDQMKAGGSTNGAAGLELAYQTAQQAFLTGGVNRVVLATDGDWNVGVTSQGGLLGLIQEKAKSGIFLTCLGYGMGNLKDSTLEMLADKGNGNYGYIDSTREARKVLVEGASGTLVTIAKDVKIQVEFNPARVASYRLVGYDNRLLAAKDFNDDTKDAGEIGAGHTVTALYELVPVGVEDVPPAKPATPEVDPLKYQGTGAPPLAAPVAAPAPAPTVPAAVAGETLTVKLRFKQPDGQTSVKREYGLTDEGGSYEKASPDFKFASSVAAFALILKGSPYAGTASLETVLELASEGLSFDPSGYRKEFLDLVARAIGMHLGK